MENKFIHIEQAYFGEVGRSHNMIDATIDDRALMGELVAITDKPSNTNGMAVGTYYSAVTLDQFFVLTKTMPAPTASRSGMVFSHVILIRTLDLPLANNLKDICQLFVDQQPAVPEKLSTIAFEVRAEKSFALTKYPNSAVLAVRHLLKGLKIEYFGQAEDFITMIDLIWNGLPGSLRQHLTYGIGFSVTDLERKAVKAIYFRPELANRITSKDPIYETDNEEVEVTDSVERFILGTRESNEFLKFLTDFQIGLTDFNSLSNTNKAFHLFHKADSISPDELRQLIRLLAKLSPNPDQGKAAKSQVIALAASMIISGQDYNIKALRNLDLLPFAGAEFILSNAVDSFIDLQFSDQLSFSSANINELTALYQQERSDAWWFKVLGKSLQSAFTNAGSFKNIWQLFGLESLNPDPLFQFLRKDGASEEHLLGALPTSLTKANALALKPYFKKNNWYRLYAQTGLFYQNTQEALKEQLIVESGLNLDLSLGSRLIAEKMTDKELLTITLMDLDKRTYELFGKRLLVDHSLLAELDVAKPGWLKIWADHVSAKVDLWAGIAQREAKAGQLIQLIAGNVSVPDKLVEYLSDTVYADLSAFPDRDDFWKHIQPDYRDSFVNATALGYADQLAGGHQFEKPAEQILLKHLTTDHFVINYLSKYRSNMEAAIAFFDQLHLSKDDYLAGFIDLFSGNITDFTSARLGKLIQSRNFSKTAQSVFNKAKSNTSFRIALEQCKDSVKLTIWDKLMHGGLFGISVDENVTYEALLDFSKHAYSQGPEENDIWKRAGGDNSKLKNGVMREENWRHAIHLLRQGAGGKDISVKKLIKEMLEDHGHSRELQELYKYFK